MADVAFNIALGRMHDFAIENDDGFGLLLLETAQADDTLRDHDDVADMLAAANTEAAFTNYARKTDLTATVDLDDTNNRVDIDLPDQTFTSAGNGTNETLVKAVVFWDPSTGSGDGSLIPIGAWDIDVTTNGTDLTIVFDAVGFVRIS